MKTTLGDAEIFWTEAGSGPVLLFLHGLPFQKGMWAPQLAALSRKWRVVAVDLRGFGESSLPASGTPSVDTYAADVEGLVEHLGQGPVVVAGHSMGGYVGLALARKRPDLLRGLVMVASRATADSAEAAANRRSVALRLATESPEFVAESMLPRMPSTESRDMGLRREIRNLMAPLRADGIAFAQRALADRPDSTSCLSRIPCPALVVAGERDAVVPIEESGIFAAGFAKGRLAVIENAGHMVSWEQPKAFQNALEGWLATLS